jgi:hypothetical protein
MNTPRKESISFDLPASYRILVLGALVPSWSDRLEGMSLSERPSESGLPVTTLQGELCDQAALIGVLVTLYELHVPILVVQCLDGNAGNQR